MHFLELTDFTPTQIDKILAMAGEMATVTNKPLAGKTAALFFPESSLRTRITFEKALFELGCQTILFPPATLDKPEALVDVMGYLENWVDLLVVRHGSLDLLKALATSKVPVINAMTKSNHPCEVLTDLYAISKLRPDYRDLQYTFVGENGNIGRAWLELSKAYSLNLVQVAPEKERMSGCRFETDLESVLPTTDVIITDGLPPDYQNPHYYEAYQITKERMERCKPGALLNPCPPFTRGGEVSACAIDSHYFVGYGFKSALLDVQKAIILFSMECL